MRHELHTEITIQAPVETVWGVLTELDHYAEWNPLIVEASGTVRVGERLTNRLVPPGGKTMTFRPTVTELVEGQVFEWLGHLGVRGVFDGRHRFELHPECDGTTRLVHSEQLSGLLVRPMKKSLDSQTRAGFEAMNVAVRERAESRVRCQS